MAKKLKKISGFKGFTKVEDIFDIQETSVVVLRKGHFQAPRECIARSGKLGKVQVATKSKCGGKLRYRDRKEALRALHRIEVTRAYKESDGLNSNRRESRTYSCPDCLGAHLTSKPLHSSPALRLIQGAVGQQVATWELSHVA